MQKRLVSLIEDLLKYLQASWPAVRVAAARAVSSICYSDFESVMPLLLKRSRDLLDSTSLDDRQTCMFMLMDLVDRSALRILPYIVFFVGPVLARMSDSSKDIRGMAAHCFAKLLVLLPIEVTTQT